MTAFSIERAANKQFYARFKANNNTLVWDTLPDLYKQKKAAIKAILLIARYFDNHQVEIVDNSGFKPILFNAFLDVNHKLIIEIIKDATAS